jgi:carboxymethylenebutenolidase
MQTHIPISYLPTGFALAAQPVSATAITTDTNGLSAGEVSIPAGDRDIPGYRAMPYSGKTFPLILVIQEIFGVHEHIRDVCRRLAKIGYMAVAPDLYSRQGDVSAMQDIQEIVSKVVSKVPDSQVISDLDAAVEWAGRSGAGDINRLGATGFCWGGRMVWLYAAHNPRLKAGVAWYGRLMSPSNEMTPKHPLDVAADLKAPVLGLYGGNDPTIPLDLVEKMRSALRAAGKPSEIVVYPEAPHGFFADYRPSYRKEAAEDGWRRLQAWFRDHGVV